jgi:hypothetical protein
LARLNLLTTARAAYNLAIVELRMFKQKYYMTRILALAIFATAAVTYASNLPYQPCTHPEKLEFAQDRLDVYPDDVRKDLAAYTNTPVVWVGLIKSTDARDKDSGNKIDADTVLEHHYFDWVQDGKGHGAKLAVSPRGEGNFRLKWTLKKTEYDSDYQGAEEYAHKGKLAIVYGIPSSIDTNGTIVLSYHYIRVVDKKHFNMDQFDYGRLGEPFREIHGHTMTNAAAMSGH